MLHTVPNKSRNFQHFHVHCASQTGSLVHANTHVHTVQTNNIQLLPVDDDRVRGRLVTVATTLLVTAAANGDAGARNDGEEEEKKKRVVNLGVTAHMSALTSNTVERREVAIIKQSFFHSSKADIHSCCTHSEQYAPLRPCISNYS